MTSYTTYQILAQAGTSMLAQANERPSQVLAAVSSRKVLNKRTWQNDKRMQTTIYTSDYTGEFHAVDRDPV